MSTQEVPEWLKDTIADLRDDIVNKAVAHVVKGGSSGEAARMSDEYETEAIQTILSHMIDKQNVEETLSELEFDHRYDTDAEDVSLFADEIRRALNIRKEKEL